MEKNKDIKYKIRLEDGIDYQCETCKRKIEDGVFLEKNNKHFHQKCLEKKEK